MDIDDIVNIMKRYPNVINGVIISKYSKQHLVRFLFDIIFNRYRLLNTQNGMSKFPINKSS